MSTLRKLIDLDTQAVPKENLMQTMQAISKAITTLKIPMDDLKEQLAHLKGRADTELLADFKKLPEGAKDPEDDAWGSTLTVEFGKLSRTARTDMKLPVNDAGDPSMPMLIRYCMDMYQNSQSTEQPLSIEETFLTYIKGMSADPKGFADIPDDELPMKMKRMKSYSVKFTPKK